MDDIYSILVTMDYPDAITNGLRRQTDIIRAIIERTRGDVTSVCAGEKTGAIHCPFERTLARIRKHAGKSAAPASIGTGLNKHVSQRPPSSFNPPYLFT